MNMAQQPQGASRFTGIGVVIVVHALMIAGLTSGLVQHITKKPPPLTEARLIEPDKTPPPPPVERVVMQDPTQAMVVQQPTILPVPIIEDHIPPVAPPSDLAGVTPRTGGTSTGTGSTGVAQVEKQVVPAVVTPGMVCTKMGKPDLPAVSWAGDALFRVQATVRGGRVAATEFTVLSGVMDPKTRRALQSAIANTLRDTYECPGEHRFEQEFSIRID